jgi:curved DNA-binding protein CbpA
MSEKSLYEILEVSENASSETIAAAYRSLSKRYHPDVHRDKTRATVKMQELNSAFEVLGDEKKRQAYDSARRGPSDKGGTRTQTPATPPLTPPAQRWTLGAVLTWATVILVGACAFLISVESRTGDSESKIDAFEVALRNYVRAGSERGYSRLYPPEQDSSYIRISTGVVPTDQSFLTKLNTLCDRANALCSHNKVVAQQRINAAVAEYAKAKGAPDPFAGAISVFDPSRPDLDPPDAWAKAERARYTWAIRSPLFVVVPVGISVVVAYILCRLLLSLLRLLWMSALGMLRQASSAARGQAY